MLYTLASCEKLNTGLYSNGNDVISHKLAFLPSLGGLVLGIFSIVAPLVNLGIAYEAGTFSLSTHQPITLFMLGFILLGIWLIAQGKTGIEIRKEQGGIHPEDTLIIFDANHKTVTKQKGTTEELLTSFADMRFEIRIDRSNKQIKYRVVMLYPKGMERITSTGNRARAEEVLQSIKTRLNIV